MKTSFLVILLLLGRPAKEDVKQYLSCHVTNISFNEFTNEVYRQTGIKIFFDEKQVNDIKVTLDADSISVGDALKKVLVGTGLKASPWHNNFVVIRNEYLLSSLPDYHQFIRNKEILDTSQKALTETEIRYFQAKMVSETPTIRVGKSGGQIKNLNAKILGKIIDLSTGESVSDATVILLELGNGAVTDKNGYFSMLVPPGKYNAKIESLGYEKKTVPVEILSGGELVVEIKKENILINELVFFGDRQTNIRSKDPGLELLAAKTIKDIPVMIGERDILKASSLLPGIVSIGEGSAGLNVRGGSSDQNAFYLNKIPIYNTSHLFGFFPAFNADIIKDFSLFKGYVPAQFGGKLSSVFNVTTRQANQKHFNIRGGVNPVTGYVTVETPIIKETLSMMVSARKSYSDWILSKIKDPTIRNSSAKFYDLSTSLDFNYKKNKVTFFLYNSNDIFNLSDLNKYEYSNLGSSLNLHHVFNTSIQGDFSIVGSKYSYLTIDNQIESKAYKNDYKIEHYEIKSDINHYINNNISFDYGASAILYKLDHGSVLPYGRESIKTPLDLGKEKGIESAIYLTNKLNIFDNLSLTLGYRQAVFTPMGSKSVYTYNPNAPRETNYIVDTLNFGQNEPIKWYFSPEFRANINFKTDRDGSIKLAMNQMQQNIFMLSNTASVSPNTQWKLADYNIKPSKSIQYSIGVFRNIPKWGLETSVEVYYKKVDNFPDFKDGANFIGSSSVETTILQGSQTAYGIEFYIKRSGRKLDGWISYAYSRSFVQVTGPNSWNRINEGFKFPSNNDIPHALNALINYHFNRRYTISTITTYQTGRPVTYPTSTYFINGIQFADYSKRNKFNIPDYFRIDASLTIEGNLNKKKLLHNSIMISVYNLTGRRNPYSIYYKSIGPLIYSYKYSVIGIPIFTVTWIFKLGNYEAN